MVAQVTTANLKPSTATPGKRMKNYLLLVSGSLQAAGGALMVAAPHLQTVLTPGRFAATMIVTGVVTAALAFISTQLNGRQEE